MIFILSYFSSGDSKGSTPAQSEAVYDAVIAMHPSNILTLNHETKGKFMINALNIWTFNSDHIFLQNPLREYLFNISGLNTECWQKFSHQVLPYAIKKLQAAGYRLVTVSECTGLQPYQSVQAPGIRDVSYQMMLLILLNDVFCPCDSRRGRADSPFFLDSDIELWIPIDRIFRTILNLKTLGLTFYIYITFVSFLRYLVIFQTSLVFQ